MPVVPKMVEHFLHRCTAFPALHNEQEASSYFPGVEWKYPYLLIFELSVLIEEILESEKKLILFLVRKTRQSYILYNIDEGIYSTVIMYIPKKIIESFKNLEIRIIYIFPVGLIFIEIQKIREDRLIFIFYRQRLDSVGNECIQAIICFFCPLSCEFDLAKHIFHTGKYHTIIQGEFLDSSTIHS